MSHVVHTGGGVVIPALKQSHDTVDGGVKKPVRYGTRVRNKQKKDQAHQGGDGDKGKEQEPSMEANSKPLEEEQQTEAVTKGATGLYIYNNVLLYPACITGGSVASEGQVPDNWDSDAASSEQVSSTIQLNCYCLSVIYNDIIGGRS